MDHYWQDYYACPRCEAGVARWPQSLLAHRLPSRFFPAITVLAAIGVLVAVLLARRWRRSNWAKALAAMICTLSMVDLFYISNTQWPRWPIYADVRRERDVFASLVSFAEPRRLEASLANPFARHHSVGLNSGWGFIRHEQFYEQYFDAYDGLARRDVPEDQVAAARRFFGVDQCGKRLYLTSRIDYTTPVDFMADVDASMASGGATVEIAFFDGDTLRLNVSNQRAAWLSYIDNWDANWTATVDGRDVVIERLFGSYKSVRVPGGRSTVVFSYRPGLFPSVAK